VIENQYVKVRCTYGAAQQHRRHLETIVTRLSLSAYAVMSFSLSVADSGQYWLYCCENDN